MILEIMHGLNMTVLDMPQDLVVALVLDQLPAAVALTITVGARTRIAPGTVNVQASSQDGVEASNH